MDASDYYETYDFTKIEEMYTSFLGDQDLSAQSIWNCIFTGNYGEISSRLVTLFKENTLGELERNKNLLLIFVIMGLIAVVIRYVSVLFRESQTVETAKQILNISFLTFGIVAVVRGISISKLFLERLYGISLVSLPVYLISMSLAQSITMANAFSQIFSVVMFVVEGIIGKLVFPFLATLEILNLIDASILEERLHTAIEYGEKLILYMMKGFLCIISAFGYIQANVLSASAEVRKTAYGSLGSLLPGIGKLAEESLDIFWGSTSLIFQCMGSFASILLLLICAIPFLKMVFLLGIIRMAESLIGILGEKTLKKGVHVTGDSIRLMVHILFDTLCFFLLTIALASVSVK